jgi:hypothetical protein
MSKQKTTTLEKINLITTLYSLHLKIIDAQSGATIDVLEFFVLGDYVGPDHNLKKYADTASNLLI